MQVEYDQANPNSPTGGLSRRSHLQRRTGLRRGMFEVLELANLVSYAIPNLIQG